jgi:hypothetical protein
MTTSQAERLEPAHLDVFAPGFTLDSEQALAARERHWYATIDPGIAILRHQEVGELAADKRLRHGFPDLAGYDGPVAEWLNNMILTAVDEKHERLRRLVVRAFAATKVERFRECSQKTARVLVDNLERLMSDDGSADFVAHFANKYPIRVLCEVLGIPQSKADRLGELVDTLAHITLTPVEPHIPGAEAALAELYEFCHYIIAQRRREPGDDLLSALVAAEVNSDRLSHDELRAMIVALLAAGHDTTRCQIGLGLATFLNHPEQWSLLSDRPDLIGQAVEEVMRVAPQSPTIWRVAREDVVFRDQLIPCGSNVLLCITLAHTDPRVYGPSPRFDITVKRPATFAFGTAGAHYCIGSHLAKIELQEAFLALSSRFPEIESAKEATWRPYLGITGPETLYISS